MCLLRCHHPDSKLPQASAGIRTGCLLWSRPRCSRASLVRQRLQQGWGSCSWACRATQCHSWRTCLGGLSCRKYFGTNRGQASSLTI